MCVRADVLQKVLARYSLAGLRIARCGSVAFRRVARYFSLYSRASTALHSLSALWLVANRIKVLSWGIYIFT